MEGDSHDEPSLFGRAAVGSVAISIDYMAPRRRLPKIRRTGSADALRAQLTVAPPAIVT
jgi:hypothetical protein